MKHCPACGGRVDDTFHACPACGKDLEPAKAISRLNVKRDRVAAAAQKPLSQQHSQMETGIVTNKASIEYGMASGSSIWHETKKGGSAPPSAKKVRARALEGTATAQAEAVGGQSAPAPDFASGGIREVGEGEDILAAGAASGAEAYTCYRCGGPLRFVEEYQRWYCDNCYAYV